jgi:hypothetical protein
VGSIACIDPDGTKQVEIFTSFDTLEAVIEGIAKLKERMRDETITLDITPPKRP